MFQIPEAKPFTLSEGQENAQNAFIAMLNSPVDHILVIEGYAGTGKSTLVDTLMKNLDSFMKMAQLLNPSAPTYEVALTATTNKAAEVFSQMTGMSVTTIHTYLELFVHKDFKTGKSTLKYKQGDPKFCKLLIIDEASMIDKDLLRLIFERTENCKIVFIGDPAQILPINSHNAPAFCSGFTTATMDEVLRQAEGSPIIAAATSFRNTVNTGIWTPFKPDGQAIQVVEREDFYNLIIDEFTRPGWKFRDSKVLAWTNACVIEYNHAINGKVSGTAEISVGDYVVNNKMVTNGSSKINTDQQVYVTKIEEDCEEFGVRGRLVQLDYKHSFFFPDSLDAKAARIKQAKANDEYSVLKHIDERWIDLRSAFAQTYNKSQGSTYDMVFLDLDDLNKCHNANAIARYLYVGFSRARHRVYVTGTIG